MVKVINVLVEGGKEEGHITISRLKTGVILRAGGKEVLLTAAQAEEVGEELLQVAKLIKQITGVPTKIE